MVKHLLQELALTCHKDPAGTIRHDDNETTIETQQNQTFYVHKTYIIISTNGTGQGIAYGFWEGSGGKLYIWIAETRCFPYKIKLQPPH